MLWGGQETDLRIWVWCEDKKQDGDCKSIILCPSTDAGGQYVLQSRD